MSEFITFVVAYHFKSEWLHPYYYLIKFWVYQIFLFPIICICIVISTKSFPVRCCQLVWPSLPCPLPVWRNLDFQMMMIVMIMLMVMIIIMVMMMINFISNTKISSKMKMITHTYTRHKYFCPGNFEQLPAMASYQNIYI